MALKAIIDTTDGLDDTLKGMYKPLEGAEGKFVLDVEGADGFELEDVSGLKTSLSKERGTAQSLERELKKFGSTYDKNTGKWTHSIDPVKAQQALAKYDEFMSLDPAKEADKIAETKIAAVKDQLVQQHSVELQSKEAKVNTLTKALDKVLREQTARAEIAGAKGEPLLLLPHVMSQTRTVEDDDGNFRVEVIDASGNVRIGDAKGNPMTIAQLVAEMRNSEVFGRAFEGDGTSGSGKRQTNGGGTPSQLKRSTMTPKEKADYQREHGREAYLKLPG